MGKRFGDFFSHSFSDVSKSAWSAPIIAFLQLFPMSKFVGASLNFRVDRLRISLAQRRFGFLNRMNKLLVLSYSHLAVKLSKRLGFHSSQCGNLAILCQASEYEIVIPNKKFKPDYQRVALLVPMSFVFTVHY